MCGLPRIPSGLGLHTVGPCLRLHSLVLSQEVWTSGVGLSGGRREHASPMGRRGLRTAAVSAPLLWTFPLAGGRLGGASGAGWRWPCWPSSPRAAGRLLSSRPRPGKMSSSCWPASSPKKSRPWPACWPARWSWCTRSCVRPGSGLSLVALGASGVSEEIRGRLTSGLGTLTRSCWPTPKGTCAGTSARGCSSRRQSSRPSIARWCNRRCPRTSHRCLRFHWMANQALCGCISPCQCALLGAGGGAGGQAALALS